MRVFTNHQKKEAIQVQSAQKLYTTSEVANMLPKPMNRNSLAQLVWRVRELRPAKIVPPGTFQWTQFEIDRLIAYRNRRKKA